MLYDRIIKQGTINEPGGKPDPQFALPSTVNWMHALRILVEDQGISFATADEFYNKQGKRTMDALVENTVMEQLFLGLHHLSALEQFRSGSKASDYARVGNLPTCPEHLNTAAREEWERLAGVLHEMGVVTLVDRAALAAYCQCYGRWVEAEEKLQATPMLLKTATGYVQQSPWLSIANKQLELMGRYMAELGLTPASRSRVAAYADATSEQDRVTRIELVTVYTDANGQRVEGPMSKNPTHLLKEPATSGRTVHTIELDGNL